ncbi:MAG: RNA-guided endonuclease InsQ/TnpB family protein, partial [Candidatus Odinarchaeota archaeon]
DSLLDLFSVHQKFPEKDVTNIYLLANTIVSELFGGEQELVRQAAGNEYYSLFHVFEDQHGLISFIHEISMKHGFNMASTSPRSLPSLACFDAIDHALRSTFIHARECSASTIELALKLPLDRILVIRASRAGVIFSKNLHGFKWYVSIKKALDKLEQLEASELEHGSSKQPVEGTGTGNNQNITTVKDSPSGMDTELVKNSQQNVENVEEQDNGTLRIAKNKKIAETRKATRERRKDMICKTYELKINKSRMSKKALNFLIRLFLEAKWFYNYILDQPDPFNVDTRIKKVPVVTGDKIEERELLNLSGKIKQELAKRVTTAIKSLSKKKEKGAKVGRLKFKSRVTSIPLKQYGITHRFLTDKRLKIEKLSSSLRIRGVNQIPGGAEFANAHLITKHGDYFLKITVYLPKGNGSSPPEASVGIDTGLAHQFTFSSGVQVKYRIPVGNKLRKLCKKLSRQQRWSNNWYKTITKIQKEYVRIFNTKKDIRNKLASFLRANYKIICFQDESLKAWQRLWGSKMMDTSLGAFLTALRERTVTPVEVDRFFPSTQLCSNPECDHKQKMALQERIYVCPECGLVIDRDFNSSINIEIEGLAILGLVWTEPGLATAGSMPVETRSSTLMVDYFNSIPYVKASRVAEPSWKETGSHLDSIKDW